MEKAVSISAEQSRRSSPILSLTWPIFIELLLQLLVGNADQIMVCLLYTSYRIFQNSSPGYQPVR